MWVYSFGYFLYPLFLSKCFTIASFSQSVTIPDSIEALHMSTEALHMSIEALHMSIEALHMSIEALHMSIGGFFINFTHFS